MLAASLEEDHTPSITIVGLGPRLLNHLTKEAENELELAEKIFFRTSIHPVYNWLASLGKKLVSFDHLYSLPWERPGQIYEFIVTALLREAHARGIAVYALPGSPFVLERTTELLRREATAQNIEIKFIHGLSFLEESCAQSGFDASSGLQIVLPRAHLETGLFHTKTPLLVCQIEAKSVPLDDSRVDLTMQWLLVKYPPSHPVALIWTNGPPDYQTQSKQFHLDALLREYGEAKYFASLFVPPLPK